MNNDPKTNNTARATHWQILRRLAPRWAALGLILTSCACSTVNRQLASKDEDPFLSDDAPVAQVAATAPKSAIEPAGTAKVRLTPSTPVQQADYRAMRRPNPAADRAVRHIAAEVRMPLDCPPAPGLCPDDCQRGCPGTGAGCDERFADEYLCDGGDRDLPVHYDEQQMLGLDTEDTVAEYYDDEDRRRVKPANKVCIYSPRFASVVSVSAPTEDVGGGRPIQAIAAAHGVGLQNRNATVAHNQTDMTERLVSRLRGSGLRSEASAEVIERPEAIHGHVHTTTPLVNFGFLGTGQLEQSEGPWLAEQIQSAVAWTRDQNPVIAAVTDAAGELKGRFNPAEFVGRENRFNGKGKLRIVKLADKEIAVPGDVVTFKIRFDNIGDREVGDVVIVDNLTPRLEYVDGSAKCNLAGRLLTAENGEGSLILRWELDEPLPGRSGGVLTFEAKVR